MNLANHRTSIILAIVFAALLSSFWFFQDFAFIVHTAQTLWITLCGLIAILALPIINRHYVRQRFATEHTTP